MNQSTIDMVGMWCFVIIILAALSVAGYMIYLEIFKTPHEE
jgi:hypothetical protein